MALVFEWAGEMRIQVLKKKDVLIIFDLFQWQLQGKEYEVKYI